MTTLCGTPVWDELFDSQGNDSGVEHNDPTGAPNEDVVQNHLT